MRSTPKLTHLAGWRALAKFVIQRSRRERLTQVAGSLTFTTTLALVPLLAVAFALLTAFPIFANFQHSLQSWMVDSLIPDKISVQVLKYLNQFALKAKQLTAAGLIGLALSALLTLRTIDNAFNEIWQSRRQRNRLYRLLAFWAVVSIGPLLLAASLSLSSALLAHPTASDGALATLVQTMLKTLPPLLSGLAFTLLYRFVPAAEVRWRDALVGGACAAVAFEIANAGLGIFIGKFSSWTVVYGALAAVPIFLLWLYLSWLVTLVGAQITATLPVIRTGGWRHADYPGVDFYTALGLLQQLWRARAQQPPGLGESQLAAALHQDPMALQRLLALLERRGWIGRLDTPTGWRWALVGDPAAITLGDLQRLLLLDLRRLPRTPIGVHLGPGLHRLGAALQLRTPELDLQSLFGDAN